MKVRQSSTSLRFAGQQVRYVWRERGSARLLVVKKGMLLSVNVSSQIEVSLLLPRAEACQLPARTPPTTSRTKPTYMYMRYLICVSTNTCISSLTEKKSLNLFTSYNMYTKGLVNSRRRKKRARDARTILFSSVQVYIPAREGISGDRSEKKKKKK